MISQLEVGVVVRRMGWKEAGVIRLPSKEEIFYHRQQGSFPIVENDARLRLTLVEPDEAEALPPMPRIGMQLVFLRMYTSMPLNKAAQWAFLTDVVTFLGGSNLSLYRVVQRHFDGDDDLISLTERWQGIELNDPLLPLIWDQERLPQGRMDAVPGYVQFSFQILTVSGWQDIRDPRQDVK